MVEVHLPLSDAQYRYLQQRARIKGTTVETVVADLIEADIAWRQAVETDPVAALFGEIDDTFDTREIDALLYAAKSE